MENKDGLCETEVRKNLVLAEIGEPLTLPLATLNSSCQFKKEWNRIQKVWHKKKIICTVCGKEFTVSKGRSKYCSPECSKVQREAKKKAYNQTPEAKAKQKAYYQDNKKDILNKLQKRRNSPKP